MPELYGVLNNSIVTTNDILKQTTQSKVYIQCHMSTRMLDIQSDFIQSAINKFINEINNADLYNKLNKSQTADPNVSYNIIHDEIEKAKK